MDDILHNHRKYSSITENIAQYNKTHCNIFVLNSKAARKGHRGVMISTRKYALVKETRCSLDKFKVQFCEILTPVTGTL